MNKIKLAEEIEQLFLDSHENVNTMEDILNNFNQSFINKTLIDLCKLWFDNDEQERFNAQFADDYPPEDFDSLDDFKDALNDISLDSFIYFLFNDYGYEIARDFIVKLSIKQVESLTFLADEISEYIDEEGLFPESIVDACCNKLDIYKDQFKQHVDTAYDLNDIDDNINDEVIVGQYPDAGYRDGALVDIDGTILYDFDEKTHSQLLGEYFDNEDVDTVRTDAKRQLREEDIQTFTFGHICNNVILIDEPNGTTVKDVVNDIKQSDLDYNKIYLWQSNLWENDGICKRLASKT